MSEQTPTIEDELKVLRNWVIGLVTGCEGCTAEATAWVEAQGEITTEYEAEQG
jgi:hypothetical protein